MGSQLDLVNASLLEHCADHCRTGHFCTVLDRIAIAGDRDPGSIGNGPVNRRPVTEEAFSVGCIEVVDHRDHTFLTVGGSGCRCGSAAIHTDAHPNCLAKALSLRGTHLPIAFVSSGFGRRSQVSRNVNSLSGFHGCRDADIATVHVITGNKLQCIVGIPGAGTVVVNTPGLAEIVIRAVNRAILDGYVCDVAHGIYTIGCGRGGSRNRSQCGDRFLNGSVFLAEVHGEELVRNVLRGSITQHIDKMVVDDLGQCGALADTECIVFRVEATVENLILTGTAVTTVENILVDDDQIHILALHRFNAIGTVGEGKDVCERDDVSVYQIVLDPILEAGTLHHCDLHSAEAFKTDGLRLDGRCQGNEHSFTVVIGAGEVDPLCTGISLGKAAADNIELPEVQGIDHTVTGEAQLLKADAHSAANFFHQRNVHAAGRTGLIFKYEWNIFHRGAKAEHTCRFDV